MAARIGRKASAFLSGLIALGLHAGVWSVLELSAPPVGEPAAARAPALVWLENQTVLTAYADTDVATRHGARTTLPTPPARVRPRAAARSEARTCASAPATSPSLDTAAPAPSAALAEGASSGLADPRGAAVLAPATGIAGAQGDSAARAGAPAPRARLLSNHPCSGFFPGGAAADVGEVQVDVAVDATGHAALSSVLLERPAGQGFAQAAQACARKLLFAPAHDGSWAAVPVHAKLRLLFKRA